MKGVTLLLLILLATTAGANTASRWRQYQATALHSEPPRRFPHQACFERAARAHALPVTLLLAVARGESGFDPRARSQAGALGLMQILWPGTARHLGITRRERLFDPCTNVDAGARYLKELLGRYHGDLHRALAAYNYGPGRVPRTGPIPKGAAWYSTYIADHLDRVLDPQGGQGQGIDIIRFDRPYRALALLEGLRRRDRHLRLDWFEDGRGRFHVRLLCADARERRRGLKRLQRLGFDLEARR